MGIQYLRDPGVGGWLRAISVDSSFQFRHWRQHQSHMRNVNIWKPRAILRADSFRRLLFPDLSLVAASSSLVCYYNLCLATADSVEWTLKAGFSTFMHHAMMALPLECFSLTSMALGLLVTFKTQTAYARFIEGRNLWGFCINESRAYSSRILARVPSRGAPQGAEAVSLAQRHAVKWVRTFPVTMKYHLTEDGCNPHIELRPESRHPEVNRQNEQELREATSLALRAELRSIWDLDDARERACVERLMAEGVGNRCLHVLHELTHLNATVFARPGLGDLDGPAATEMDKSVTRFHDVLGACEKILRTPIYTPYTKFTSRFLTVWCTALPLALYPIVGPVGTVPCSLMISFFMLGIEDIGSRVEQPFNIMPLWQYCATIDSSCVQLVRHAEALNQLEQAKKDDLEDDAAKHSEFDDIPIETLDSWGQVVRHAEASNQPERTTEDESDDDDGKYSDFDDIPIEQLSSFGDPMAYRRK